jgi:hypothetical protein
MCFGKVAALFLFCPQPYVQTNLTYPFDVIALLLITWACVVRITNKGVCDQASALLC